MDCKHEVLNTFYLRQTPQVICSACKKRWICIPSDLYLHPSESPETLQVITDCILSGNYADACNIYLDHVYNEEAKKQHSLELDNAIDKMTLPTFKDTHKENSNG